VSEFESGVAGGEGFGLRLGGVGGGIGGGAEDERSNGVAVSALLLAAAR